MEHILNKHSLVEHLANRAKFPHGFGGGSGGVLVGRMDIISAVNKYFRLKEFNIVVYLPLFPKLDDKMCKQDTLCF